MWSNLSQAFDPMGALDSCLKVQSAWLNHPSELFKQQAQFIQDCAQIFPKAYMRCVDEEACQSHIAAQPYDERFQDSVWREHLYFDLCKEYYLLTTRWLEDRIYESPRLNVDPKTSHKAAFWVRQFLNACSPTNFLATNPKALGKAQETNGLSLFNGMMLLMEDIINQNVKMVDETPFSVGKNLATTPGKVIFRNEILELIQYTAQTNKVHAIPILIVPPWINKYYILDLNPNKSLVNFLVQQGFSVFMISWKNPTTEDRILEFEDYLFKGIQQAAQIVQQILNADALHAVGYCVGGTALTSFLAWANHDTIQKKQNPIEHATLLCTMVDFENPGEIGVFIDEPTLDFINQLMSFKGYLDGKAMADTFRWLRSNSLIWQYVVQRYLLGEEPPPFDVLYWNIDKTRLPEKMHAFYLENFYLKNKLCQKGQLKFKNLELDMGKIQQSIYAVGTEQDHITPWKETFKIAQYTNSPVRYVLATSGHILGILSPSVNPPKRHYWVCDATGANNADYWKNNTEKTLGSWWDDWKQWLGQHCGPMIDAPTVGRNPDFPALCKAPGTYVLKP
ncbi:MAG: PHA/PHB synthase family protein [Gammaproteobacteria bacterium]